jgi:hypothetical protein
MVVVIGFRRVRKIAKGYYQLHHVCPPQALFGWIFMKCDI